MAEYVEYDFNPYKLPQDLLAAIGQAVAASAQTEDILNMAIAGCLGIDAEYQIAVTQHMPLPLKFSVLVSAAEIRLDDLDALDELDNILDRIKVALEKRNALVHGQWAINPVVESVHRAAKKSRVRVESDIFPVTVDEVVKDASNIVVTGLALVSFLSRFDLMPAMPPIGRARGHKSKAARKLRRTQLGK